MEGPGQCTLFQLQLHQGLTKAQCCFNPHSPFDICLIFFFVCYGLLEINQQRNEMCSLDNDRCPGEHTRTWSQEMDPGPKSSTAQAGLRAPFPYASAYWAGESCPAFAKPSQVEGISQLQLASTMRLNHNIPKSLHIYTVPSTAAFIQTLWIPAIFCLSPSANLHVGPTLSPSLL